MQGYGYPDASHTPAAGGYMAMPPPADPMGAAVAPLPAESPRLNYMNGPGGGVTVQPAVPDRLDYVPAPATPPAPNYPAPPQSTAPDGVPSASGEATNHRLGLSIVLAGIGAVVGYQAKGPMGALAGLALGGASANAWHALRHYQQGDEEGDKEAKVDATWAALGAGLGVYLLHHISEKEKKDGKSYASNEGGDDFGADDDSPDADGDEGDATPEEDEPEIVPRGACPIRRTGP